jgi:hypothetical protein
MATKLLPIEELDRRHVAAWEEYLRKYAPDNRARRQVFTGAKGVTDNRVTDITKASQIYPCHG